MDSVAHRKQLSIITNVNFHNHIISNEAPSHLINHGSICVSYHLVIRRKRFANNFNSSLVVETFNLEKNGRKAYFTPSEAPFFIEQHIQNPLESFVGKLFYGCSKFCIIQLS